MQETHLELVSGRIIMVLGDNKGQKYEKTID